MTADFRFKVSGKLNKWNALNGDFELDTVLGNIGIETNNTLLINELVEAMKNRNKVSITIEKEK